MTIDLNDEIVQDFLIEAGEILEKLSEQLVGLESSPQDTELLNAVFRAFHTVKGGAGFIGLDPLVEVCHRAEDIFNLLRQGERQVDPVLMDAMLQVLDTVNGMFAEIQTGQDPTPASQALLEQLHALEHGEVASEPQPVAAQAQPVVVEPQSEPAAVEADEAAAEVPAEAGPEATGHAPEPGSGGDEITDAEFEKLLDDLHGKGRHGGLPSQAPAAEAEAAQDVQESQASEAADKSAAGAKAGADDQITEDEFEALLDSLHGAGRAPTGPAETTPAPAEPQKAEAAEQPQSSAPAPAAAKPTPARGGGEATVRVDTGVLDRIMNMVGELVLVRNRIATLRNSVTDEQMVEAVGNLDVVTADLQAAVMRTRMQPIRKVFGRFPRVVRDLARNLGKEVELVTRGEDTDLDKNLVEALADPMVHLVRNAVDHGIEMPDVRTAKGKPRKGTLKLSAEQEGDHILLTVADDGAGIDSEVLRRKAVDKGIMDADAAARLAEQDCFHLIFAPGFSTRAEISDVSGRGVGMDVVKTRIAQLNGSVSIDSAVGEGTRIGIRVPLTLAIVPTLTVVLGTQIFALPLTSVKEIFELDPSRTNVVDGKLMAVVRGKPLPLFFLRQWLLQGVGMGERHGHVVVVHVGTQTVGFVVDQLIGQEEVVIKPLGAMLQGTQGLAGATITGDGRIALIIDVPGLVSAYA